MRGVRLFAIGVAVQCAFGFLSLLVVRWGFRSWPQGAYTWIPGALSAGSLLVLAGIGYSLARRGSPIALTAFAWLTGRLMSVLASSLVPGVGIDNGLLAVASFGLVSIDSQGLTTGQPSLGSLLAHLAVLAAAHMSGRLRGGSSSAGRGASS